MSSYLYEKLQEYYGADGPTNFTTWADFGKLWIWAKAQDWWVDYVDRYDDNGYDFSLIDPVEFPKTIYNYLKENE